MPKKEDKPQIVTRNQEMVDKRNAIADSADDVRDEDLQDVDGERVVVEEETAPVEQSETDETESSAEVVAEEEAENQDERVIDGIAYHRCIVNGREKWLTLSQLRATAQKVESADEYLQNAAESVRSASKLALSSQDAQEIGEDDPEKLLHSAIMGDEDAIKKLAQHLKARPSRVTPDVLQAVDERMSFRQAAEWFNEEYADLLSDPLLKKLVHDRDAEMAKESPSTPYRERLKNVGEEIRGWKQKMSGGRLSNDKAARKASVANVPSAATRQTAPVDDDQEEPVENVIAKMAAARGQARSIQH